jgi:hypothetical protein
MSTGGIPHIPHAFTQGFIASAGARPAREIDPKKAATKPRASDEVTLGHTNEDADVDRVDMLDFQHDQHDQQDCKGQQRQQSMQNHARDEVTAAPIDRSAHTGSTQVPAQSDQSSHQRVGRAGIPLQIVDGRAAQVKVEAAKRIDLAG